jgi:hypothetical protein
MSQIGKMTHPRDELLILETMNEPTHWYQEREADWEAFFATLRVEGWTVKHVGLAAPLQLEGRLPNGEAFYFRARRDEVSLGVGGDPCWYPVWEGREPYGSDENASYLPGKDGLAVLRRIVDAYRAA